MNKQDQKSHIKPDVFYRCRPTMSEVNIIGPYLVDLECINIQFFHLKDFTFYKRLPVLSKQDQYCAQMNVLNSKILIIFGVDKFMLFNIDLMEVVENVKINNYIEKIQVRNNFIVILTSDEDSEQKIINCWRINPTTGKVQQKYKSTQFLPVQYEECTEDNMCMSLIISIQGHPKIYVYWRDTVYMIEIDPRNQTTEKYSRHSRVFLSYDLTSQTYAQIIDNHIFVNSKKTGKKLAQLKNQGEKFIQLFSDGSNDKLFSLSNFGLKKWKLQSNSAPALYASSEKQNLKKIFFGENQQIIAINTDTNTVFIWKNEQQYSSHSFPNQVIRKMIKLNNHQAFFLLQATASSQQQNQYQVSKYNKLEVYDFSIDNQISKKAMLKFQHSIDIDSTIVNDADTIRFIVNQKGQQGESDKKYILRWTPFSKDQNNKDTKRKQIKGANSFDVVRLYPFNRILGLTFPKKQQSFSLFSKQEPQKTQIVIYDYSVKKIGDYDFQGNYQNIELSQKNLIYTIGTNRICIYSIATQHKNRLQKINQLDISAVSVSPFGDFLLIKKQTSFLLLDRDFECIMRQQTKKQDKSYKIIQISADKFLLKTELSLTAWDTSSQNVTQIEAPECQPNIVEFMDGKLVIADKWIQAYDIKLS